MDVAHPSVKGLFSELRHVKVVVATQLWEKMEPENFFHLSKMELCSVFMLQELMEYVFDFLPLCEFFHISHVSKHWRYKEAGNSSYMMSVSHDDIFPWEQSHNPRIAWEPSQVITIALGPLGTISEPIGMVGIHRERSITIREHFGNSGTLWDLWELPGKRVPSTC